MYTHQSMYILNSLYSSGCVIKAMDIQYFKWEIWVYFQNCKWEKINKLFWKLTHLFSAQISSLILSYTWGLVKGEKTNITNSLIITRTFCVCFPYQSEVKIYVLTNSEGKITKRGYNEVFNKGNVCKILAHVMCKKHKIR